LPLLLYEKGNMSLNKPEGLVQIAKQKCRKLRREQTPAEKIMWGILRNRKLSGIKFLRQHPIFYDLDGIESFFIADFYSYKLKLIVEIDGPIHKYRLQYDRKRDKIISELGITVLRVTNEEIENNLQEVLKVIDNLK
jgi:very-short-patch-repair endonuclease